MENERTVRQLEVKHLPSDYNDVPTVDELINHLGQQTGLQLEEGIAWYDGDRTASDFADSEANVTE